MALSSSVLVDWHVSFWIAGLSLFFLVLEFHLYQHVSLLILVLWHCCTLLNSSSGISSVVISADRFLIHCFGALWVGPWAWSMGNAYSFCVASEQKYLKGVIIIFSLRCKKYKKWWPIQKVFQPHTRYPSPTDWQWQENFFLVQTQIWLSWNLLQHQFTWQITIGQIFTIIQQPRV